MADEPQTPPRPITRAAEQPSIGLAYIPFVGGAMYRSALRSAEQDQQDRQFLFQQIQKNPSLLLDENVQGETRQLFGDEVANAWIQRATEAAAQQSMAQAQQAQAGQSPLGQFIPAAVGPGGETLSMITPSGAGVAAGQAGVAPPIMPGALSTGRAQESVTIGPKGVSRTIAPTTPGEQQFRGESQFLRDFESMRNTLVAQGFPEVQARQIAAQAAASQPGARVPENRPDILEDLQVPLTGTSVPPEVAGAGSRATRQFGERVAGLTAERVTPRNLENADRQAFTNAQTAINGLDGMFQLFQRIENRAGPIRGRVTKARDLLALEPGAVREFTSFRLAVRDALRQRVTGAAAPFQELRNINRRIPDLDDPPEQFAAGLRAALRDVQASLQGSSDVLKTQNFIVPDIALPPSLQALAAEGDPEVQAEADTFLQNLGLGQPAPAPAPVQ